MDVRDLALRRTGQNLGFRAPQQFFCQSRFTGTCLASDSALRPVAVGKVLPEIARGAFAKACKALGVDRILKIRFCRFHRVFKKFRNQDQF